MYISFELGLVKSSSKKHLKEITQPTSILLTIVHTKKSLCFRNWTKYSVPVCKWGANGLLPSCDIILIQKFTFV